MHPVITDLLACLVKSTRRLKCSECAHRAAEVLRRLPCHAPFTCMHAECHRLSIDSNATMLMYVCAQEVGGAENVKSEKKCCGEVIGIVTRTWRARGYAGTLKEDTQATPGRTSNALFVARDRSVPFISFQTRQAANLMDKLVVVVVDEWPVHSRHPLGHYVRTIGKIGETETESEAILLEHDVNTAPFTSAVHACVPPLPGPDKHGNPRYWQPSAEEIEVPWRRDLRDLCVCSVDPPGCKDIDDALHARQLPNGNIEVGVHIADVSNFCNAGSPMDEEAARRSTTVYLVNRRIDMFPKPLTEDICRCCCCKSAAL